MQYKVVSQECYKSHHRDWFESAVVALVDQGWELQGGVAVHGVVLAQALIKRETKFRWWNGPWLKVKRLINRKDS